MSLRIAILSAAHMHCFGYASAISSNPDTELVGVWDDDAAQGQALAKKYNAPYFTDLGAALGEADAVVVTSENKRHAELAAAAAEAGKHVLCEKPLVTSEAEGVAMLAAVRAAGVKLMTAFPCRFSPAYRRLKERCASGDIGDTLAVCATNHGMCPFGWFVEADKSGGGALMDHTVHVADLLCDLLTDVPDRIYAQTSNNIFGQSWDDTAMLQVRFKGGVFATIDSSWSRPQAYKTWGDVRMSVVGTKGVLEMDMFGQAYDWYRTVDSRHAQAGFGSDLDAELVREFASCIREDRQPLVTGEDGLRAARFAFAGYESARTGQPVAA
jgi:predicted dehydrogenase